MDSQHPVQFGLVGLGGYAGAILRLLRDTQEQSPSLVRLAASYEPDTETHAETIAELKAAGVTICSSLDELLDQPIDAVWLPLPIQLHKPFTIQVLEAGKAVVCEKPAAGSVDDVDAMIAARDKAGLPVAIGYQTMYDPATLTAKRKLLEGAIGRVQHATMWASWPRSFTYFNRSNWAGAFKRGGDWVMDSPLNNALAHYVNLPLFLLGQEEDQSAEITAVQAELYRTYPIENYDTACVRLTLANDAQLTLYATHAGATQTSPVITIQGERGRITWNFGKGTRIERDNGETIDIPHQDTRRSMIEQVAALIRGKANPDQAVASLEIARAQVVATNAASESNPVYDIDPQAIRREQHDDQEWLVVDGLVEMIKTAAEANLMLHDTGLADWTRPAESMPVTGYDHFAGPKQETPASR